MKLNNPKLNTMKTNDKLIEKLKRDLVVYMKGYKVESTFTEEEINLIIKSLESKQTEERDSLQSSEPEKTAVEISISKEILKMELLKYELFHKNSEESAITWINDYLKTI